MKLVVQIVKYIHHIGWSILELCNSLFNTPSLKWSRVSIPLTIC